MACRRRKREAAQRDRIDARLTNVDDHRAGRAATQRFFRRPQHVLQAGGGDGDQPFRRKAAFVEAGAAQRAALGERDVLGNGDDGAAALDQAEREAGRGGEMRLALRGDLVQRAAHQAAAERGIERRNAERPGGGVFRDAGGPLKGPHDLAQLVEHAHVSHEDRADFAQASDRTPQTGLFCRFSGSFRS